MKKENKDNNWSTHLDCYQSGIVSSSEIESNLLSSQTLSDYEQHAILAERALVSEQNADALGVDEYVHDAYMGLGSRDRSIIYLSQGLSQGQDKDRDQNRDGKSLSRSKPNPWTYIWDLVQVPALLFTIGVCCAILSFSVTHMINFTKAYRTSLVKTQIDQGFSFDLFDFESGSYKDLGVYVCFCVCMTLLSCLVTQTICPASATSGLPEMKAILSGT